MNRYHTSHRVSCLLVCLLGISLLSYSSPVWGKKKSGIKKANITSPENDSNYLYMKGRQLSLEGKYSEAVEYLEKALKVDSDNAYLNHQISEIYLRLTKFERAEELAKKAVEKEPKNLEYLNNLAMIYTSLKRYDEAKEQYQQILKIEPNNKRAPLFLGILEAENGNLSKGISILSKAISSNKENYMAYYYRAKIYLEKNEIDEAKEDLNECLDLRPNFEEAGTALGLLHERLGETDKAIETYNRIRGNGRFKKRLAQLYLQKNEFEKALAELLDYEKVELDDYTARVKIALIYFELKKYDEAKGRFEKILKEQPNADVRFYLAAVYEEQKKYNQAIKEFKKVAKDSSFFKESMLHVGFIYRKLDRTKEGILFSKTLLKKNQDVVEFYDMHASFYEQNKQYKKAQKVIAKGLKKFPTDEKLLYFEGALFDKLGDREKAITNMKKIVAKNDKNAHALNFLGYTYAEIGKNLDEAEKLIRKAMKLRPNDGYIEDSLGWIFFKQGKIKEAVKQLEKAIALQPEEPVILEHLGDVYMGMEQYDKATEAYKKAVALSTKKKDDEMVKKIENKLASIENKKRVPSGNKEESKKSPKE